MKEYQIVKHYSNKKSMYGVVTKKDLQKFAKTNFLPVVLFMKKKKDLIFVIENNKHYEKLKNNTTYKTIEIY